MCINKQAGPFIELRGVTKTFPVAEREFSALSNVDLELPKGEFVAIVGKSGSGKSTLLNLVAGIDRPTGGEVIVGGTPLRALRESRLAQWRGRHVGVVFQFFQLLPSLTVLENVMLPMDFAGTYPARQARTRALELLERMGIVNQADKRPATLSGGQQQRAAIARALANDPPLLVADEPTGNLDSQAAASVFDLLVAESRAGKTVLMVTHERDISSRADRVIELSDGNIARQSTGGLS